MIAAPATSSSTPSPVATPRAASCAAQTRTAPAAPALIELAGVEGAAHGSGAALHGIDLRVEQNEFIAITGAAHAGKSALLNLLAGLEAPGAGSYSFRGVRVDTLSHTNLSLLRRFFIGHVPPGFHPRQARTVQDYVEAPYAAYAASGDSALTRRITAEAALESAGLPGWGGARLTGLTRAQLRRAAIARALVTRPALLLVDEDGADEARALTRSSDEIMELLGELHRDGELTVIAVSADARAAQGARRVLHMQDGRIARETRDYTLRA